MNKGIKLQDFENTSFFSTRMKMELITQETLKARVKGYLLQRKYNGCYTLLIIDDYGQAEVYNQNFAKVPNLKDAVMEGRNKLSAGYVYICEAIVRDKETGKEDFEEASRSFNPNNNVKSNGNVKLVIFDRVTLQEFINGKSETKLLDRLVDLDDLHYNYEC